MHSKGSGWDILAGSFASLEAPMEKFRLLGSAYADAALDFYIIGDCLEYGGDRVYREAWAVVAQV